MDIFQISSVWQIQHMCRTCTLNIQKGLHVTFGSCVPSNGKVHIEQNRTKVHVVFSMLLVKEWYQFALTYNMQQLCWQVQAVYKEPKPAES